MKDNEKLDGELNHVSVVVFSNRRSIITGFVDRSGIMCILYSSCLTAGIVFTHFRRLPSSGVYFLQLKVGKNTVLSTILRIPGN